MKHKDLQKVWVESFRIKPIMTKYIINIFWITKGKSELIKTGFKWELVLNALNVFGCIDGYKCIMYCIIEIVHALWYWDCIFCLWMLE